MRSRSRARYWLGWVLVVELVAFTATAIYLAVFYRPTPAQAWNDVYALRDAQGSRAKASLEISTRSVIAVSASGASGSVSMASTT